MRWLRIGLISIAGLLVAILVTGGIYYHRCAKKIDQRLAAGVLTDASEIYGAPVVIQNGDTFSGGELKWLLQSAGYKVSGGDTSVQAEPGPQNSGAAPIAIALNPKHQITQIESGGHTAKSIDLDPIPIANVSTRRDKREPVTFDQIPPVLVHAVLAAEDKRFFHHDGVDLERVLKATWVDFRTHRKEQGASTLTMQLVRNIWLDPDKTWRRKIEEIMMTSHLERKWPKKEIFAQYANQVYLGRQAAYNLHGFAEGARVFFNKPLGDVTLPEAATLAGMVQRPSYYNPFRNPEAATTRRNLVLEMMRTDKFITPGEYESAVAAPLGIHEGSDPAAAEGSPYYLDLVAAELEASDNQHGAKSVYTTIDPRLQQAASDAIASGMKEVDRQLASRYAKTGHRAEAALIALDPHTGEIKALVGGRNYAASQLNRVLANRPPGSVFKPFVYAAAVESGMDKSGSMMTEASMVDDSPASITWNRSQYQPKNFKGETYGNQMLIDALAHSDNVAAVKVAEQVGLDKVVAMARRVGLNSHIQATPAVALGAYAVTPLEVAGAYTTFANGGIWEKPHLISEIRDSDGNPVRFTADESRKAMSPEVAAVMVTMLQQVVQSGTAASVRSRGFTLPSAGKTGTSHDGWFAGFTTRLLCIVWVGFDDYSDLNLEGAKSALPIWTAFMKEAANFTPYREAGAFSAPGMLDKEVVCPQSGQLASDQCPVKRVAYFISGTAPQATCTMHTLQDNVVDLSNGAAPNSAAPTTDNTAGSTTIQVPAPPVPPVPAAPAQPVAPAVPAVAATPAIPPLPAPPPNENSGPPL